jgi:AcrR family transcriptional regulator
MPNERSLGEWMKPMTRRSARDSGNNSESQGDRVRSAAARLFAERGFARASMRDLAGAAGMSLSGLYHYFEGKDDLLYELQRDAFERLTGPLAELPEDLSPAAKIERLVLNHIEFFASHITEMKVLSHESNALSDELARKMRRLRRNYYDLCLAIVTDLLKSRRRRDLDPRIATMSLFGMINWIYTWYKPATDGPAAQLAKQMTEIFLHGVDRET